jgi:ABC-2 type transport system permease protein
MSVARRVAREEWRWMARGRVALLGVVLLTILSAVAAVTAHDQRRVAQAERSRYQAEANRQFANQPDRHPHRVAHYGHLLFRPLDPLAAFDPGIDPFTGSLLFLEAHRRNEADFGDVRQSSLLVRFGQLTPAFVLQVLAPLLLIFVGHAAIARERASGMMRVMLAQGVPATRLVAGKLVALGGVAAVILAPAALALVWIGLHGQVPTLRLLALAAGYALWLAIWVAAVVLASALARRGSEALLALLAIWSLSVIVAPRVVPVLANRLVTVPTRVEAEVAVARDLARLGDPHDPTGALFLRFRDATLNHYGVARIEDLPVNFRGLIAMESERQSSALFDRYAAAIADRQARQVRLVDRLGLFFPVLALRELSMAAAGTDLAAYRRFEDQGEAYRYTLVQGLNRLEAERLRYADDSDPTKENRLSRVHWQRVPAFHFVPAAAADTLGRVAPAGAVLLGWLLLLGGLVAAATRRLTGDVR